MNLSPVENYLEAIRFGSPEYMPRGNEEIFHNVHIRGTFSYDEWVDNWGIRWKTEIPQTAPFPIESPLPDITKLHEYELPNPDSFFDDINDEITKIKQAKAEGKLIISGLTYFIFERAWAIMGMDNFFMAMLDEPDLVRELLHKIAVYNKRFFDNMMEIGVDAVSFSEDLGTQRALMFSPAHFYDFFLPEYIFAFENVLKEEKMVVFHSCGRIDEVIQGFSDIKVTVLNPIQARANDLEKIKKITFGKTALSGGVDSHLLMVGTTKEVQKETARVIEILKPGGGYICEPDQGFPNYPPENIEAMYKTATELGRY